MSRLLVLLAGVAAIVLAILAFNTNNPSDMQDYIRWGIVASGSGLVVSALPV